MEDDNIQALLRETHPSFNSKHEYDRDDNLVILLLPFINLRH